MIRKKQFNKFCHFFKAFPYSLFHFTCICFERRRDFPTISTQWQIRLKILFLAYAIFLLRSDMLWWYILFDNSFSQLKFVSWNLKSLSFDPTVICYSSINWQSVNKHYLFLNHLSRGGRIDIMFLLPAEVLFHLSLGVSSLHWVLKDVCQWGHVRDQEPRWLIPNEAETNWYQQAAEMIVTSCKTRGHDLRLKGVVAERQIKQPVFIRGKIQIQSKAARNCKIHNWNHELGRRKNIS